MKNGKAEVLSTEFEEAPNGCLNMRVKLASLADRDLFIILTQNFSAEGTIFELVSDTEVLCKPPQRNED